MLVRPLLPPFSPPSRPLDVVVVVASTVVPLAIMGDEMMKVLQQPRARHASQQTLPPIFHLLKWPGQAPTAGLVLCTATRTRCHPLLASPAVVTIQSFVPFVPYLPL
jgi:hypothetical protein